MKAPYPLLSGCGTALLTPFKKDGSVDYDAYIQCVERQVAAGIDFLVPLGTTGETPCLSVEERREILRLTREHAPGLPIIAGVGTNSLTGTLENIKSLEGVDPDAYLVVVPYYNKPTQEGLYQYFTAVANAANKPIILYNVPGRTGANLAAETTLRLASHPNIIAVKEASGN
ncbi:MAG: dihydrodipicolinate synthase family protein, partial [Bacteroidota bacterium]|nr:dihydrodipicolinate synthase family protein [Bacteroidota bacterium]